MKERVKILLQYFEKMCNEIKLDNMFLAYRVRLPSGDATAVD